VPEPLRLIGHGEAAQIASLGPAALQGRALKVACDDDWVLDKNGKTETSRFTLFLNAFPYRPLLLYACFLLYFLLVFSSRAGPYKRKAKGAAAPKPAAACEGGSCGGGDGGSGV
jgi:hypothetical protein